MKENIGKLGGNVMSAGDRRIHISICDDEKALCSELEGMLSDIADQLSITVQIDIWYTGEGLKDYLEKGNHSDIIFLDIELMNLTGIDVGNYIRRELNDNQTQIVYISSKTSYALKLFKTQPYDFLVKPIRKKDLYEVTRGIIHILPTQKHIFVYQYDRKDHHIDCDKIVYFRSELHRIVIVTMQNEITFYGKLADVMKQVPIQFIPIHKSYLINKDFVENYSFHYIEMANGETLNISRTYQKTVREKLRKRGNEQNDSR